MSNIIIFDYLLNSSLIRFLYGNNIKLGDF